MPGYCPVTLKAQDPDGFVHTGTTLPCYEPEIAVSVLGCKLLGAEVGMVDEDVHAATLAELEECRADLEQAQDELRETQQFVDAIHVIESKDFRARKKPGRKPAAKAA